VGKFIKTTPIELYGTELGYYLDTLYMKQLKNEPMPDAITVYETVIEKLDFYLDKKHWDKRGLYYKYRTTSSVEL